MYLPQTVITSWMSILPIRLTMDKESIKSNMSKRRWKWQVYNVWWDLPVWLYDSGSVFRNCSALDEMPKGWITVIFKVQLGLKPMAMRKGESCLSDSHMVQRSLEKKTIVLPWLVVVSGRFSSWNDQVLFQKLFSTNVNLPCISFWGP
jgi:hypothetical protein